VVPKIRISVVSGRLTAPGRVQFDVSNCWAQLPGAILLGFLYIQKVQKWRNFIYTGRNLVLSGRNLEWLPGAVDKKSLTTLIQILE
jgi:hypothetical protein